MEELSGALKVNFVVTSTPTHLLLAWVIPHLPSQVFPDLATPPAAVVVV